VNNFFKYFFVLIIFLIVCITSLSSKNSDEVVFWTLQMSDFAPYMNKVIANFEKQNPDIKIKWIDIPFSEGEKRTLASVLSDTPPDLINLNPDFSALLAQRGVLYEIPENQTIQFNKSIIESLKYNGKLYSLPWYATSAITIYNKKLFKQAKINMPETYTDIAKYAKTIKDQTGAFAIMPNITENDTMARILNKYGVVSPELIDSEKSQKVFGMFKTLYENNLIPNETITQTHREVLEKYMAEKIIFFQAGANFLTMIKENAPLVYENTDVAPQLTGDLGQNDFSLMNFVIPIKSNHKEQALKFALFLTNNENQLELAKLTNILAVNDKTLKSNFYNNYNDLQSKARVISAKQLNKVNPVLQSGKNQKEINTLINTAVQQILLNKAAIPDVLNEVKLKYKEL